MNELNVLRLKVESSTHNCRVGNRYPMRPGMVPAQSKAIFGPSYETAVSVPRHIHVSKSVKLCLKGGFCEPGGGHGSIEWCEKCNNVI